MNIHKATREFEHWLTRYTTLVPEGIAFKHEQMAVGTFPFFRATFYRWAQVWSKGSELNVDLAKAPVVLSVGDLHIQNFGTWRDAEGRLCWGVNDFDEAAYLPYTNDLVRLATSVNLAIEEDRLTLSRAVAAASILAGYVAGTKAKGRPFVLEEDHASLRSLAVSSLRDPTLFWKKMRALPPETETIFESARVALEDSLPLRGMSYTLKRRVAGLGNLGKPRYTAIAPLNGGLIAREAKALVPSAIVWAKQAEEAAPEIFYQAIVDRSIRCRDPFVTLSGHWIVRRLGPYCSRIDMDVPRPLAEEKDILFAMGWETANIHLGSFGQAAAVQNDLKRRKVGWLAEAAALMTKETQEDWRDWCKDASVLSETKPRGGGRKRTSAIRPPMD